MRLHNIPRHALAAAASALVALTLLTSCGVPGASGGGHLTAPPSPSPGPGQRVLEQARGAPLADATFTLTSASRHTAATTPPAQPITGTGQGALTMHPRRTHATYRLVASDSSPDDVEHILDYATKTDYAKDSLMLPGTDLWLPVPMDSPAAFFIPDVPLDYLQLADATLIATEQVSGEAVWHLRGTLADGNETGVIDVYLAKDTYLPVKETLHVTTPDTVQDETYVFTAVNTGVTVALPSPDQVEP